MNKTSKKTSLRFHLSKKALQNMQFSLKLHTVSNVMKIFSMTQESHGTMVVSILHHVLLSI